MTIVWKKIMLALHMEEKEFYPGTFIVHPNELDIPLCKNSTLARDGKKHDIGYFTFPNGPAFRTQSVKCSS